MAPNVGPFRRSEGEQKRETGYYSDQSLDSLHAAYGEAADLPPESCRRCLTFRKGKMSHQYASTLSDDEVSAKEDLGTRRTTRRTRRSDGYYYPLGDHLGQQSSDVTASGGACGSQWAGPKDPSLGDSVNRPNVMGLGVGTLGSSNKRSNYESSRRPVLPS